MKALRAQMGTLMSRLFRNRRLPVPSPKALLLALVIGPAVLIALISLQSDSVHAQPHSNVGSGYAVQSSAPHLQEISIASGLDAALDTAALLLRR